MSKINDLFISNLRRLMEKAGINQAELARRLGWPPQHVNNYLTGVREPGLEKVAEIAAVFGLKPGALLDTSKVPEPTPLPQPSVEDALRVLSAFVKGHANLSPIKRGIIDRIAALEDSEASLLQDAIDGFLSSAEESDPRPEYGIPGDGDVRNTKTQPKRKHKKA